MTSSKTADVRALSFIVLATLSFSQAAHAAGLFLAPRGVRPLGRGGAFVAGADDLNALSYNPAALTQAGRGVLVDAALSFSSTDYTRTVTATSDPLPTVTGTGLLLPLPTIGVVHDFGLVQGLTFAAGIAADTPVLQNYDDEDGPQRYAIHSYSGTALSKLAIGAAYAILPELSFGVTGQLLFGTFVDKKTSSSCDGVICTAPEDPAFDTDVQIIARNMVSPGVHAGVLFVPNPWLRVGLSWESGFAIDHEAEMRIRLPSDPSYADATLSPDEPRARVKFKLPWTARGGIEVRPLEALRVEAAFVYEAWSVYDQVQIEPQDVTILDVLALGDYQLGNISLNAAFENTFSVRFGGEYGVTEALTLRAGGIYEPSAVPDATLTPQWADLDKVIVALGVGYAFGGVALDATVAHAFLSPREVTTSTFLQTNPVRPPFSGRTAVGNGTYEGQATIVGLSFRLSLE